MAHEHHVGNGLVTTSAGTLDRLILSNNNLIGGLSECLQTVIRKPMEQSIENSNLSRPFHFECKHVSEKSDEWFPNTEIEQWFLFKHYIAHICICASEE